MKPVTFDQAEAKRQKAVQFLADVVGDQDKADEFDAMSTNEYIEHRGLRLANPARRPNTMALTKTQLEARLREMQEENEALQEQLDAVADIVSSEDDDDECEDEEDDADAGDLDDDADDSDEDDEDDRGN